MTKKPIEKKCKLFFEEYAYKPIFAIPKQGSLAQLVQSICLTSRGSLVRTQ